MGLQISECATVAEYKTKSGAENGGDYIYVNKFNHSLLFSDNGTKSIMSEAIIQEDNVSWYVDFNSQEDASARIGTSSHPFASMDELLLFLPKHTNGHSVSLYLKASTENQEITLDGYENLEVHGWDNTALKTIVLSLINCKNVTVFATDTDTVANAVDIKIGSITGSDDIVITAGESATEDGIMLVAGPIIDSKVTSDADIVINTEAAVSGPTYFDIKEHSVVVFTSVDADAMKTIRVDNSEFSADSVIYCNLSALNNGNIRIATLYRAKDSAKQTTITADTLSNITVNAYAKDSSEDSDRDYLFVSASNNSHISVIGATDEVIPVKKILAQTGSYITVAVLTGYTTSGTLTQPQIESHMTSTVMYVADTNTTGLEPVETKDTMGQINVVEGGSAQDLSNYVTYSASTVSNS